MTDVLIDVRVRCNNGLAQNTTLSIGNKFDRKSFS